MSLLDTASLIVTPNGYKEGKLYSVIPSDGSGDLSVTRATTATRVNSAGLVELVPYNLVPYSQEFSNSSFWSYYISSVTANTTTAPDGTMTADTLLITSGINGSTYQTFSSYSGGVYNLSAYYKKTNEDVVYMDCSSSGGYFGASFNLTTQAISTFGGGFSPLIESVGGGWYRCSVNGYIEGNGGFGFGIYAGAGQSAYIWGTQLNEGGLKDYQKTETRLNIPRLDYSNGTCPSLLVEPQRTNGLLYSEQFNNGASWGGNGIASYQYVSNPVTGLNNAMKITKVTGNTDPYFQQGVGAGAGAWTYSMWLWTDSGQPTTAAFYMFNSTISEFYAQSITLTNVPTRYTFTSNFTNTGGYIIVRTVLSGADANQYIYAYGGQAEAGSYPTSYIPTTSASVTRNADQVAKTGISSLIGQTEGAVFIDLNIDSSFAQNDMRFINVGDGTAANWYFIGTNASNQIRFYYRTSNTAYVSFTTTLTNGRHKLAYAYANGDYVAYVDGTLVHSDNTIVVGSASQLNLGNDFGNFSPSKQFINAAALWKTRLTNTQLAQLTTI